MSTRTNVINVFPACGQTTGRIVGGDEATENQLPWQCAIKNIDDTFYGCGATIISCDPVIIISAAHCFQVSYFIIIKLRALIWCWDHLKNFIAEIPQGPLGISIGTILVTKKKFQGPQSHDHNEGF